MRLFTVLGPSRRLNGLLVIALVALLLGDLHADAPSSTWSPRTQEVLSSDFTAEDMGLVLHFQIDKKFLSAGPTPPTSRVKFCERTDEEIQATAQHPANSPSFLNQGGFKFFGKTIISGTCWWHSRLRRAIAYLTIMRPDLPKPSPREAKAIVRKLISQKSVVEIPGYDSFIAFSADFPEIVQQALSHWQFMDGVFRFSWIRALRGSSIESPSILKERMDRLYELVNLNHEVVFQKLKIRGIRWDAHSWLVSKMERREHGYVLTVIDSNSLNPQTITYRDGDPALILVELPGLQQVLDDLPEERQKLLHTKNLAGVPYPSYDGEYRKLLQVKKRYCSTKP